MRSVKECPSCAVEVPRSAQVCPVCGYEFPRVPVAHRAVFLLVLIAFVLPLVLAVLRYLGR